MSTSFYAHTSRFSGKLRTRLAALAAGLLLAPAAWAQIDVPAGNPIGTNDRRPLGTWFGYERSAMIYTAAEIATSGNLTQIAFYLNAVDMPGAAPTKVYLKTVSNASFAAPTTVATEEAGATLVYDATIPASSFRPSTWITLPLTAPFAYDGTSNLEVIVETNVTVTGNERSSGKSFRHTPTGTSNRAQFWRADNSPPTVVGTLSLLRPNIRLTGLAPLTCLPVTGVSVSNITTTSAQLSFTPGSGNTSYTVTYTPTGGTATTVTPAPTASPVSLTGLVEGTTYTVTIAGNCTGGTTSPTVTTSFSTALTPPANNECATATVLTPAATCIPIITTNRGATASAGAPAPNSSTTGCFVANTPVNNDVWYSIVVPASGGLIVTTSAVPGSDVRDTGMTLYTGTCGALTEVACSDDAGGSFFARVQAAGLTPGSTVYARAWSFGNSPTGQFGICAVSLPANDAAVRVLYALGKVPTGVAQVVQAVITNVGAQALTNLPVTLGITGATTFDDAKIIATLAPGASTTVSFAPYTSNTTGTNTLTVSVPADDVATNNAQTYTQLVTNNTFSYANNSPLDPDQSVGFPAVTTGALVVKYTTSVARSLTGITVALADVNTVGRTVYAVVLSSSGAVLARTPDYVVTVADINQRKTFPLPMRLALNAGDFYVGLVQTAVPGGTGYFPVATLPEDPTRPGTYFAVAPFSPTTGGTLTDAASSNLGILVVEAETEQVLGTSAALNRAIHLYPNPSQGRVTLDIREAQAKGPLQVQVSNLLGQVVHTALVRDNAQNPLDLSGLAQGMYTLRVHAGSEYTIRQLVLTK